MGNLMTSMWSGVAGLKVNQMALNTTSHNLSNIDTKGYVRQQVLLRDERYTTIGETHISKMQIGLGTNVDAIRQVRDVFLDKSYRLESGRQNFYKIQAQAAEEIEMIFGEFGDDTFATSVDNLWSAINGVAEEPDSIVKRSQLATTASTFINYAGLLRDQLNEYQDKINMKIQEQVDRINEIGDQLKQLNTEIIYQESGGQNANDYRDTRNLLLDELAGYVNITYQEDIDGRVLVNIEGTQFVTLDRVFHLRTVEVIAEEKQATADAIDLLSAGEGGLNTKSILNEIKEAIKKLEALKDPKDPNATVNPDDVIAKVKESETWSNWSKYGTMEIAYNGGNYVVTMDGTEQVVKTSNGEDNTGTSSYEPNVLGEIRKALEVYASETDATKKAENVLKYVRNTQAWKDLSKYGNLGLHYDKDTAEYSVTFNDLELINTKDGSKPDPTTAGGTMVLDYEPIPTGFQNVIWDETGFDVFRMTGEYASYNNTDVGSLKSILIARGGYTPDYTDIPQTPVMPVKADYCEADGVTFKQPNGENNYNRAVKDYEEALANYPAAVEKYDKDMGACLLMNTQAQLDLLVHKVVTTINDIFSPSITITKESVKEHLGLKGTEVDGANGVDLSTAVIHVNGTSYTIEEAESMGLRILDIKNASIGMDDNATIGEALFERKNVERYTEAKLLNADGSEVKDKDGNPIILKVYNEEYETDIHSMFTIGQIRVNQDMIDDVSKMPLNYNKYSELYGSYNFDICQEILDVWGTNSIQLSPNVYTTYNFTDYYDAIAGNIGTTGGLYATKQDILEETVLAVGTSRESILGVSSEEELMNLITYQHAYNASSRYINVISELLETLINIGQ